MGDGEVVNGEMADDETTDARWAEAYERQVAREERIPCWFDDVGLRAGETVVEVGCGPGHVALLAAARVGPRGRVYALDNQPGALSYLDRRRAEEGGETVRSVVTDATALAVHFVDPVVALLTYVLHHVDDPAAVLDELHGALPPSSRLFVCEYHPDADGAVGPSLDRRVAPEQVRRWTTSAGFELDRRTEYDDESYAFLARR